MKLGEKLRHRLRRAGGHALSWRRRARRGCSGEQDDFGFGKAASDRLDRLPLLSGSKRQALAHFQRRGGVIQSSSSNLCIERNRKMRAQL